MLARLLVIFSFTCLFFTHYTQVIDAPSAKQCAEFFLSNATSLSANSSHELVLEKTVYTDVNGQTYPAFYVFNDYTNNRFILVSANKLAIPILAYSTDGNFSLDTNSMSPAVRFFLSRATTNMQEIIAANDAVLNAENIANWDKLLGSIPSTGVRASVAPLLSTKWGQRAPFNALTPPNTPTGCTAVVLTQLMKYYKYPTYGQNSHGYIHPTYGYHSVNFEDQQYNWASMPNTPTTSTASYLTNPIAKAMYHVGVGVDMDYSTTGSNASVLNLYTAIQKYYGYSLINNSTLLNELNNSRPVITISEQTYGTGSHVYLVDGYDNNNLYHVNWGWAGLDDGYYSLSNLVAGGTRYDYPINFSYFEPSYFLGLSSPITLNTNNVIGQPYSVSFGVQNSGKKTYTGSFKVQVLNSVGTVLAEQDVNGVSMNPGASSNYNVSFASYSSNIKEIKVTYNIYNTYRNVHKLAYRNPQPVTAVVSTNPCMNSLPISCGQTVYGNTANGTNAFNNYNCASQNEYGKELIYEFTLTQTSNVQAKLTNLSADLDVHILSTCGVSGCIARGDNTANGYNLSPGTYYISVDGYGTNYSRVGTFNLTLNCTPTSTGNTGSGSGSGSGSGGSTAGTGSCTSPITIACGETKSGNTMYGTSTINQYGCGSQAEYGKELFYQFILTQTSDVYIELSNMVYDLDVQLLQTACVASSCIGRGDRIINKYNLPAGTYYIAVDGYGYNTSRAGSFNLKVNCTPSNVVNTGSVGSCLSPLEIACGETKYGNTANGYNHFNTYSCGTQNEYGKDLVYHFSLSQTSDVDIKLSNLSVDLDLQLLETSCSNTSCIARNDSRIQYNDLPSGDYYIVVDGYGTNSSLAGSFTLTFNCITSSGLTPGDNSGTSITEPLPISCGSVVSNNTLNGVNNYNQYPNCSAFFSGNEIVYELSLQETSDIELYLNSVNDQEVFLMDANGACYERSQNGFLTVSQVLAGVYYLVVDGPVNGSFTLTLDCTPSPTITGNTSGVEEIGKDVFAIDFTVYPNPTSGELNIQLDNAQAEEVTKLEIMGVNGKVVYTQSMQKNQDFYRLDLTGYLEAKGLYFIRIATANQTTTKRFVYR